MRGELGDLYARRFSDQDVAKKEGVWGEITRYLQRYIPRGATVLDVACDRGFFIRNIDANEKWAADLRDVSGYLTQDINFVKADGLTLASVLPKHKFDVVFMSNYLEHLASNHEVLEQFRVVRDLVREGGRVIVLQPNIRLIGGRYWDFIDHSVALTERSIVEAGELAGFQPLTVIPRFLPYTTKSRLPSSRRAVRAYLAAPVIWRLLGRQTLYVGETYRSSSQGGGLPRRPGDARS